MHIFHKCRDELEKFLSGTSLEACPKLYRAATRFRFANIVERKVEGLHAQVHMHLKHHVSLVHI